MPIILRTFLALLSAAALYTFIAKMPAEATVAYHKTPTPYELMENRPRTFDEALTDFVIRYYPGPRTKHQRVAPPRANQGHKSRNFDKRAGEIDWAVRQWLEFEEENGGLDVANDPQRNALTHGLLTGVTRYIPHIFLAFLWVLVMILVGRHVLRAVYRPGTILCIMVAGVLVPFLTLEPSRTYFDLYRPPLPSVKEISTAVALPGSRSMDIDFIENKDPGWVGADLRHVREQFETKLQGLRRYYKDSVIREHIRRTKRGLIDGYNNRPPIPGLKRNR